MDRHVVRSLLPPAYEPGTDYPSVGAFWDAVDVYRLFALLYACYEFGTRQPQVQRPWLGWCVLAVLAAWTVAMLVHRRRTTRQLWIELCLSTAAILATIWVDAPQVRQTGVSTVPGIWAGAIVLAAGVHRGPVAAIGAWAVIVTADLVEIGTATQGTMHNVFLLFIMAGCAGLAAQAARRGDDSLRAGLRLRAQVSERERLARTVHDGVLQALAFIHRRGEEIGGPSRELGELAARQERRLRDLITTPPVPLGAEPDDSTGWSAGSRHASSVGTVDLTAAVRLVAAAQGDRVQVAAPAEPVSLRADRADGLVAAVSAALDNVAAHAGPQANTWILVEDDDGDVVVTVRDDGVGMEPGVAQRAARSGRLGIASSIVGRLRDLGGSAECHSAPGAGTSWELRLPSGGRGQEPRMQEPRMQEPRMQEPRMQAPRTQEPRMQEDR